MLLVPSAPGFTNPGYPGSLLIRLFPDYKTPPGDFPLTPQRTGYHEQKGLDPFWPKPFIVVGTLARHS